MKETAAQNGSNGSKRSKRLKTAQMVGKLGALGWGNCRCRGGARCRRGARLTLPLTTSHVEKALRIQRRLSRAAVTRLFFFRVWPRMTPIFFVRYTLHDMVHAATRCMLRHGH